MSGPGLLAGRYRLLERRDHTGATWRSRDELLAREVTIAEVPLPPPGPGRDRLLGHIRAAADLRHPGVATLHDVISAPDRLWLVTEAVEGRSLAQAVRADGPLPAERAAEVGLRVLEALSAARERGIRLSATPDTVLLAADGRVVLTGVAAPVPADDLRDLGAVLFTAVEGRTPDTGARSAPLLAGGLPLADPATGPAGVTGSGPLAPLVEELLAADPARRPDVASVRLSLEEVAPRPAPSRRRPPIAGAVALAVVLAGGAVLAGAVFFRPRPAVPSPPPAAAPAPSPTFFTAAPDACSLITASGAQELSLETTPSREKGNRCSWGTDDQSQASNLRYRLLVEVLRYGSAERAHRDYTRFLKEDGARTKTTVGLPLTMVRPPAPLPGVASEAYTLEVTNRLTYNTGVVARTANLVVSVQYQRGGEEDTRGTTRRGALQATRWVLTALGRAG